MHQEELKDLWNQNAKAVHAFLLHLTKNEADASDLLQEVFRRVIRRPELLEQVEVPRAFLLKLAKNALIDHARHQQVRQRAFEALGMGGLDRVARQVDPDASLLRRAIEKALAQLPEEQRQVVHAKLWEKLSLQEMAQRFGIPLNTAASRCRYGLDKMRGALRPLYDELISQHQTDKPMKEDEFNEEQPLIQPLEARRVPSATGGVLGAIPVDDAHEHEAEAGDDLDQLEQLPEATISSGTLSLNGTENYEGTLDPEWLAFGNLGEAEQNSSELPDAPELVFCRMEIPAVSEGDPLSFGNLIGEVSLEEGHEPLDIDFALAEMTGEEPGTGGMIHLDYFVHNEDGTTVHYHDGIAEVVDRIHIDPMPETIGKPTGEPEKLGEKESTEGHDGDGVVGKSVHSTDEPADAEVAPKDKVISKSSAQSVERVDVELSSATARPTPSESEASEIPALETTSTYVVEGVALQEPASTLPAPEVGASAPVHLHAGLEQSQPVGQPAAPVSPLPEVAKTSFGAAPEQLEQVSFEPSTVSLNHVEDHIGDHAEAEAEVEQWVVADETSGPSAEEGHPAPLVPEVIAQTSQAAAVLGAAALGNTVPSTSRKKK